MTRLPRSAPGAEAAGAASETLASATYAKLRRDIVAADFRPGQKLLLRELCRRYAVGLAPVREALNRLTSDELVVQLDQRGFRVADVSPAQLEDMTQTRCLLECDCVRDAVRRGDQDWRDGLEAAYRRLERIEAAALDDPSISYLDWEEAHRDFHAALIAGTSSAIRRKLCAQLWMMGERYRHLAGRRGPATGPGRGAEHRAICQAALAGDAEGAAALLERHYRETAVAVLQTLGR